MKKFFVPVLLLSIFFITLLTASGCSPETGPSVAIRFGELWDREFNVSERIKGLDGEQVNMTGFMAVQSPLDGSFIYLTNAPMVTCPYCIPGTNTPVFAVPAIAPPRNPIKFTEQPVTITGKLEVAEKKDEFGYTTPFRINIETLKIADISEMPQSLRDYTMLTSEGITGEITAFIDKAYNITTGDAAVTVGNAVIIPQMELAEINRLRNRVRSYNIDSFDYLIAILDDLSDLASKLNALIETDETENLSEHSQEAFQLWEDYFDWANNMAAIE